MKFRFVHEHREAFRVGVMCEVLKVSRSGYYAWRERPHSEREQANQRLRKAIENPASTLSGEDQSAAAAG